MGDMAAEEIVSEGLELAGDPSLSARGLVWLNAFLGSVYAKNAWEFLSQWYDPFALAAASVDFGDGSQTTDRISRIHRGVIATGAGQVIGDIPLMEGGGVSNGAVPGLISTTSTGRPSMLYRQALTPTSWRLFPNRTPDRSYSVALYAQRQPAAVGVDDTPIYPNDETLIHAVYLGGIRHAQDERFALEAAALRAMVSEDKVSWGVKPKRMELSQTRFRRGSGRSPSEPWPE